MLSYNRNQKALSERKIRICEAIWELLGGNKCCPLDVSEAFQNGSQTRFSQTRNIVILGADVEPGKGIDARSRMSEMACLAHELAHAERYGLKYNRPKAEELIDEAEASLHASFILTLSPKDRQDLIEDARDRTIERLTYPFIQETDHEN